MTNSCDLLINADCIATAAPTASPLIKDDLQQLQIYQKGAIAIKEDRIVMVGSQKEVFNNYPPSQAKQFFSAAGKTILPGFVDPHTHTIFGGSREDEFAERLLGVPYMEILQKGGGILETVRQTRKASFAELYQAAKKHLDRMLKGGTTTLEVKSGYGLDLNTEIKMLEVIAALNQEHPLDLIPTFLGAHALPLEYEGRSDAYIDFVIAEVLPVVSASKLAKYCDVFCEEGVFSIEQSRRLLRRAQELTFEVRFHADEMISLGGAELAAELGAVSADHLLQISENGIAQMSQKGVIATLLPTTPFTLMKEKYAPARKIIEGGVAVALASDFNPGSSPTHSMPLVLTIACLKMKMTIEEAINAATINAAFSLGLNQEVGSIEAGKKADLVVFDAPNYRYIPYHYGVNLVEAVIKNGKLVLNLT